MACLLTYQRRIDRQLSWQVNIKHHLSFLYFSEFDFGLAKHFGVEVTSEDIARAKAVGDANNDWKLTLQLIASTKPLNELPTLDQVIAKFEELYQVLHH